MISHRQIEAFRAVMLHGTVSAAADSLHVSQPAVSRIIRDLEADLGYLLFERAHGRVTPSLAAFDLLDEVERYFSGMERIDHRAREIGRGRRMGLIIAAMPALAHTLIPDALVGVLAARPELSVRVLAVRTINVLRLVESRQATLGLVAPANLGELTAVEMLDVPYRCILPAAHPLASRPLSNGHAITLEDLADWPFIRFSGDTVTGDMLDQLARAGRFTATARVDTHLSQMVSAFVLRGLGVAVVDAFTARDHQARGGVSLPVDLDGRQFRFAIAMRESSKLDRTVQALIAEMVAVTAKVAGEDSSDDLELSPGA
jgi:DNA-binding transcriptional LysR family regulator